MSRVPTDLPRLMRAYGLAYHEDVLRGPSAIVIPRNGEGLPMIEINETDPDPIKRMSIAYELARWVLAKDKLLSQSEGRKNPGPPPKPVRHDSGSPEGRGAYDPSTGLETKKIQWLAAEILLPKEGLRRFLKENGGDITAAARGFDVPRDVVIQKIRTCRLF